MKNTILFLIGCFVAAGWWQYDRVINVLRNTVNISWLSFDETDYAAARVAYMSKGNGPVKIVFISPQDAQIAESFQRSVNGASIGAERVGIGVRQSRKVELQVTVVGPGYETVNRSIASLGKDPAVLAVVLPYSSGVDIESEVYAEYLGMMILHCGNIFALREKESFLAFNNTYPVGEFSKKIAMYGDRRKLTSVLMLTEKGTSEEGFAKNQEFWFSKKGVSVPTGFHYEEKMVKGPMIAELEKRIDIFSPDSVYWGSAMGSHLPALGMSLRQSHSAMEKSENLMFLPVVADNDPSIREQLLRIEASFPNQVIAYPVVEDEQQKKEIDRLYVEKYQIKANHAAYYGYDTFMLLAESIRKNNTISPAELAQILTTQSYQGILAKYQFNEDGILGEQVVDTIRLGKIKNGALVEIPLGEITALVNTRKMEKEKVLSLTE